MKKNLVLTLLGLVVVVLVGCPQPMTPIVPVTNSGKVIVQGNLYDAIEKDDTKSVDLNGVVNYFVGRASIMRLYFYPKAGGNSIVMSTTVQPDGSYIGEFILPIGEYHVCSVISDSWERSLFCAGGQEVVVVKNQPATVNLIFDLAWWLDYYFYVEGLPGVYDGQGSATITTNDGMVYSGVYYRKGKSSDDNSSLTFQFSLPVDFDGAGSSAYLTVYDIYGQAHTAVANFNVFYSSIIFGVDYVEPTELGEVDVNIGFTHYPTVIDGQG